MWEMNFRIKNNISYFFIILLYVIIVSSHSTIAQEKINNEKVLRTIADAIIKEADFKLIDKKTGNEYRSAKDVPVNTNLQIKSRYTDWRYWNGVLNIAMLKLGNVLDESSYIKFSIENISFAFDNYKYFEDMYKSEEKWNYPFAQKFIMQELDDCGAMGASVIEVYKTDPQKRYLDYINHVADHILNIQARLDDGTLVRYFPHHWSLWADDLYMSISFLCRMGELTNDKKYFDDATKQVINYHKYLFDKSKGLMTHNWYSNIDQKGVAFWGRANGWALLAQVDLLDHLPENYPQRDTLIKLLQEHILGIAKYQSASGLWHQLLDKVDSYLETSCSAMFTYAIARAVNKGYIENRYSSITEKGWEGILTKIHPDGQIEGVCTGTSISDNLVDYYNRPAPLNDVHGIGAILLAGSEIILMKK